MNAPTSRPPAPVPALGRPTDGEHDARPFALSSLRLVDVCEQLSHRIRERFPDAGLADVAGEVVRAARATAGVSQRVGRPQWLLRSIGAALVVALLGVASAALYDLHVPMLVANVGELVQSAEALINIIVFGGIAVYFVFSIEVRIKRQRVLHNLAMLRSLAHVIDLHQLDKSPDRINDVLPRTAHSRPKLELTPAMLTRYLDYCSDLLSLLSKLAALTVQDFDDAIALDAVTDFEDLTGGMSRKIWQKIVTLDRPR